MCVQVQERLGLVSKAYLACIGGMRSAYTTEAIRSAAGLPAPEEDLLSEEEELLEEGFKLQELDQTQKQQQGQGEQDHGSSNSNSVKKNSAEEGNGHAEPSSGGRDNGNGEGSAKHT